MSATMLLFVALFTVGTATGAETEISSELLHGTRRDRFPSIEERIKVYMSNWYVPPCNGQEHATYSIHTMNRDWPMVEITDLSKANESQPAIDVESALEPDKLFWFNNEMIIDCARSQDELTEASSSWPTEERIKFRSNLRMYCDDAKEVISIVGRLRYEQDPPMPSQVPILFQFGDMMHSHVLKMVNIPHIKKFRSGSKQKDLQKAVAAGANCFNLNDRPVLQTNHEQSEMSPIVWKLATHRHFRVLPEIRQFDTPWEKKVDMAIFRGQLTGALKTYNKSISDEENCKNMIRCRLVMESDGSQYVDAKLTTTRKRLSNVISGVSMVEQKKSIKDLLKYKGIIMIEGNDVASGLKWALLSQSVVLMPRPKYTSWAMEELLEPWVHYVPLNDELDDVEEKMKWVVANDKKARAISERGTLWMEDMEFHPDSKREERTIKEQIIKRYLAHFRKV